jgi:hypothetical protein
LCLLCLLRFACLCFCIFGEGFRGPLTCLSGDWSHGVGVSGVCMVMGVLIYVITGVIDIHTPFVYIQRLDQEGSRMNAWYFTIHSFRSILPRKIQVCHSEAPIGVECVYIYTERETPMPKTPMPKTPANAQCIGYRQRKQDQGPFFVPSSSSRKNATGHFMNS